MSEAPLFYTPALGRDWKVQMCSDFVAIRNTTKCLSKSLIRIRSFRGAGTWRCSSWAKRGVHTIRSPGSNHTLWHRT